MEKISSCLSEYQLSLPSGTSLFLVFITILIALLAFAAAWILVQSRFGWLNMQYQTLDRYFSRSAPKFWGFIKARFDREQLLGLELTAAASVLLALAMLFEEILEGWIEREELYQLDQAIHCLLSDVATGWYLELFTVITHFADIITIGFLTSGLLIVLLINKYRWQALALFLAVVLGQGLLYGMKWFFNRNRPGQQLVEALGQSFPSGHAFTAMVFYGFLIFLVWYFWNGMGRKIAVSIALLALILLIAVSRLMLSVHWVSDVVGGMVIGMAWLIASLLIARAYRLFN